LVDGVGIAETRAFELQNILPLVFL